MLFRTVLRHGSCLLPPLKGPSGASELYCYVCEGLLRLVGEIWRDWTLFIRSAKCRIVTVSDVHFHSLILKWHGPITVKNSMRPLGRPLSNEAHSRIEENNLTETNPLWMLLLRMERSRWKCRISFPNLSFRRDFPSTPLSQQDKTNPSFISFNFLLWHFHNLFSFELISFKSRVPRGERCKCSCNLSSPGIYLQTPQYQENTKRGNRLFSVTQLQLLMKTPLSASPRN